MINFLDSLKHGNLIFYMNAITHFPGNVAEFPSFKAYELENLHTFQRFSFISLETHLTTYYISRYEAMQ